MADEQKPTVFLGTAVWHPLIKARNEGAKSEILRPPILYLGADRDAVVAQIAADLGGKAPKGGEVEYFAYPFVK